jgi:hypothetical protein
MSLYTLSFYLTFILFFLKLRVTFIKKNIYLKLPYDLFFPFHLKEEREREREFKITRNLDFIGRADNSVQSPSSSQIYWILNISLFIYRFTY